MGESHRYQADKDLYAFLRQREQLQYLQRHGLIMRLGGGGHVCIEPRPRDKWQDQRWWRHFRIELAAYPTGRVYAMASPWREKIIENFASVLPSVVDIARFVCGHPEPPPTGITYGRGMPERDRVAPIETMTPFFAEQRRQQEATTAAILEERRRNPPPPYVPPPPSPPAPPLTPEQYRITQSLSDAMVAETLAECDAKFIRTVQALS